MESVKLALANDMESDTCSRILAGDVIQEELFFVSFPIYRYKVSRLDFIPCLSSTITLS